MICNNSNITVRNNQAFFSYYNVTVNWMFGISPEYKDSEHLLMKHKFTKNSHKILITLLRYMGVNQHTYVSQELIAQKSGVHHDTVHRTLKLFHALGIINKKYRGANKTCTYSFSKFLHDPRVKYALKDFIPNLYWSIESCARICQKFLQGVLSPLAAIFKHDTARLSNDKKKEYKYILTREREKPKRDMISHNSWQNYLEHKLEERESMYGSHEKPKQEQVSKISADLMQDRLTICSKEVDLNRRLLMLERLKDQVERASIPFIDFQIRKVKGKLCT